MTTSLVGSDDSDSLAAVRGADATFEGERGTEKYPSGLGLGSSDVGPRRLC